MESAADRKLLSSAGQNKFIIRGDWADEISDEERRQSDPLLQGKIFYLQYLSALTFGKCEDPEGLRTGK